MKQEETKHRRRIRGLIILLVFTAMILSIATYAWFIGMRTVNVNAFDVKIASTEDLLLSLNGVEWDTTVTINEGNYNESTSKTSYGNVYQGNTNWWTELVPMSSVGEIDGAVSRMVLFEKASLTVTKGGYRLMASRVPNGIDPSTSSPYPTEHRGYVAFDLFIRNFSGTQYNADLNMDDEEAIYLSVDSKAEVALSGVENTGIENSVRVGFAQIGRVIGSTAGIGTVTTPTGNEGAITSLTCDDDDVTITTPAGSIPQTGICMNEDTNDPPKSRTAQIWEPNDTSHVKAALDYYEESCRIRTGDDTSLVASYTVTTKCSAPTQLSPGVYEYVPTYAVRIPITSGTKVDVYDGAEYNEYVDNSYDPDAPVATAPLYAFPTFTDTDKVITGVERQPLFTLAPNSVTKVRIYIWIEGQDIDNYDYAAIGKAVTINFGFTKQRFEPEDINYDGPNLRPEWSYDGTPIAYGDDFPAPGGNLVLTSGDPWDKAILKTDVTVADVYDTLLNIDHATQVMITHNIALEGSEPTQTVGAVGTYQVIYRATNINGLSTVVRRTVVVGT